MVLLMVGLGLLLLLYSILRAGVFLEVRDSLEKADAILVLGGDSLFVRTVEAVNLYKSGYAEHLIFTGCAEAGGLHNQDNPFVLRRKAIELGVQPAEIMLAAGSLDTYSDMRLAKEIIARNRFRKVILVTSSFHQRRARLLARKVLRDLGVEVFSHSVPDPSLNLRKWWDREKTRRVVFNEYKKIVASWFLGWIGPLPEVVSPVNSCEDYSSATSF